METSNVSRLARFLTRRGYACDVGYTPDPAAESDEIRLTSAVTVSVNPLSIGLEASVTLEKPAGVFTIYPARTRPSDVLPDLTAALAG
jgi:hypothetical protein